MNKFTTRDYEGNRPFYEPAVYIHLFKHSNSTKPQAFIQRLAALIRRKVTNTHNK